MGHCAHILHSRYGGFLSGFPRSPGVPPQEGGLILREVVFFADSPEVRAPCPQFQSGSAHFWPNTAHPMENGVSLAYSTLPWQILGCREREARSGPPYVDKPRPLIRIPEKEPTLTIAPRSIRRRATQPQWKTTQSRRKATQSRTATQPRQRATQPRQRATQPRCRATRCAIVWPSVANGVATS